MGASALPISVREAHLRAPAERLFPFVAVTKGYREEAAEVRQIQGELAVSAPDHRRPHGRDKPSERGSRW